RQQQVAVALAGGVVGSHDVHDPARRQVAGGGPAGGAGGEAVGEATDALLEHGWSPGAVDRAVDAAASAHAAVGGVHDRIDLLGGDVTRDDRDDSAHVCERTTHRRFHARVTPGTHDPSMDV